MASPAASDASGSLVPFARACVAIRTDPHPRAVLGCIQIPTDFVLDSEGPKLLENFPGVEMRLQKLGFTQETISEDTFAAAAANISAAARTLLPADRCTVLGLACTSMSFMLGPERVDAEFEAANPGVATTDMARAQAAALSALGARRLALLTPYVPEVADANARMLEGSGEGVRVVKRATMGLSKDTQTSAVAPSCIAEWALAVDCPEADALVIGCSAFRACGAGFIDDLEARLGKPVVTSTQAFMWQMLRRGGVSDRVAGYGALFRDH